MKTTILLTSLFLLVACSSQGSVSVSPDAKEKTLAPTSEIQITPNSSQDDQ